jgi:hypothetical protein
MRVRGEGVLIRDGFNFYPFSERHYNIGFVFQWGAFRWMCRYAPHVRKLHCYRDSW